VKVATTEVATVYYWTLDTVSTTRSRGPTERTSCRDKSTTHSKLATVHSKPKLQPDRRCAKAQRSILGNSQYHPR